MIKFKQGSNPTVRFKDVPMNVPFSVVTVSGKEGSILMKVSGNLHGKPFEGLLDFHEGYVTALDQHSEKCSCVMYKNSELTLNL